MTGGAIPDRRAFIQANTRLQRPPHAPELQLHLADEITPIWRLTEEALGELGLPPPFWAFAWAGGQALARYVLDHRDIVAGKRVLDFASGSGLVAIAAMKAGAAEVAACDIDAFAVAAITLNAEANEVVVPPIQADLVGQDGGWDAVLAGDICYERDLAAQVTEWLMSLNQRGATVLIGDPGRSYLPRQGLTKLAEYQVATTREIEDMEVKKTAVWALP